MKYNLANPKDVISARSRITYLVHKKRIVQITEVQRNRTLSQNSYLHLIIGCFALHFGYTMEEAKQVYKMISSDIYRYEKKGRVFWRSSKDINIEEMAKSIDRFMEKSAEAGCPLLIATDKEWLQSIENMMETSRRYL